jgi:cytochrome c oxidase subunit II
MGQRPSTASAARSSVPFALGGMPPGEQAATTMTLAASGSLDPAGPGAEVAADLWWLMLPLGVAVFVLFAALLGRSLFDRRGVDASAPAPDPATLTRRWILAGGVLLPLVVITVVFGATLTAMRGTPGAASSDALTIEVVGHRYWYEVRYPDQGVTTANEIHLPVGRPVSFELSSDDVIHSFWVPELGGKLDMMPDGPNTLVLRADEAGEYRGRCAEFCGLQHTRMGLIVIAEEGDDFASWLDEQRRPAVEPRDDAARRGQEVFFESDCATCHALAGTPATATDGPDLTHLASRRTLAAAMLPNEPDELAAWIRDPQEVKQGVEMPAAELTDEEIDDLVAYLGELR